MAMFDWIKDFFTRSAVVPAPSPPTPPTPAAQAAAKLETPAGRRILSRRDSDLVALEGPVDADIAIDLSGSRRLQALPDDLATGTLRLSGCTALETLPARLDVAFLDLDGCTALSSLPADLRLRGGRLNLSGCTRLTTLPEELGEVAVLDVTGCAGITDLPSGLIVTSVIEVAGSGLAGLSAVYDPVQVRWNGVAVSRQVAFAPATLTHDDVAAERDRAVQTVMAERTGYPLPT